MSRVRILRLLRGRAHRCSRTSHHARPPASNLALRCAGRPFHPFAPPQKATAIPDRLRPAPHPFGRVRHTALPRPPENASDTTLRPSQGGRSGKERRVRQRESNFSSNPYYAVAQALEVAEEMLSAARSLAFGARQLSANTYVSTEPRASSKRMPTNGAATVTERTQSFGNATARDRTQHELSGAPALISARAQVEAGIFRATA